MRVFLLVPHPLGKLDGRAFSSLASVRLRCLEIAPHLAKLGHNLKLIIDRDAPAMVRDGSFFEADAYINFKTTFNLGPYLGDAADLGKAVIVDICDNVFTGPDAAVHESLLTFATLATAPTQELADLITTRQVPAVVIPDCLEGIGAEAPAGFVDGSVRLLWFGRRSNAAPLIACLPNLLAGLTGRSLDLTVVCDAAEGLAEEISNGAPGLTVKGLEWSPSTLSEALSACHIVLTPTSLAPAYVTKSPNRLAHALWHNRPVATQPFPSLKPFEPHIAVDDDLGAAVSSMLETWPETIRRTKTGRAAVEAELHPRIVATAWDKALRRAAALAPTAARRRPSIAEVRLNIGCGDKLLPHYINIDATGDRPGPKPDRICDARDLSSFADGTVDEILSVHLIEHLARWDAPVALGEWVRVLRPGGRLIIECPNLLAACAELLQAPEAAIDLEGLAAQRTMWAFYGNPAGGDPLMMHQWGYTPDSLGQLLVEAGLVDVRSEPAKFKLGAPRDMRLVGIKPA
ncbi:MAG: methyltransferase domain-containing protein [Proteobacteria bacterium]|nr:methyltransferase domain-containing protein [Pseudomonadota bacterium]